MVTSLPALTDLGNALAEAIQSADDPEAVASFERLLRSVRLTQYRPSPRVPMSDLRDELAAADDAIGTVFEMQADGYVPKPGEIDDLRARRDAVQLEIDARQSRRTPGSVGRECIEERRLG